MPEESSRFSVAPSMPDPLALPFCVELSPPSIGWIELALRSGAAEVLIQVSHTPYDSLEEVAAAAASFLETGHVTVARLNCEPDQYDLVFEASRLRAVLYPGGRRTIASARDVLLHEGAPLVMARTFWRALRKLESQFEPEHWNHPFPSQAVERLGRLVKADEG
jgi:hypothetical protein